MELWQTGNIGSHNIKEIKGQEKNGYVSAEIAKEKMIELKEAGNWTLNNSGNTFAIMELFWSGRR